MLTVCFLMLFHGTEHKMGIEILQDKKKLKMMPVTDENSHLYTNEYICNMKVEEVYSAFDISKDCKPKTIVGLDPILFPCDKDVGQINAIEAVFPNSLISVCMLHNRISLRKALTTRKVKSSLTLNSFLKWELPSFFLVNHSLYSTTAVF